jgi:hypothetical protein
MRALERTNLPTAARGNVIAKSNSDRNEKEIPPEMGKITVVGMFVRSLVRPQTTCLSETFAPHSSASSGGAVMEDKGGRSQTETFQLLLGDFFIKNFSHYFAVQRHSLSLFACEHRRSSSSELTLAAATA